MRAKFNFLYSILFEILLLGGCDSLVVNDSIIVDNLTCEYKNNPLSVEETHPRLAWQIRHTDPTVRNQVQTAYQILVASTLDKLQVDEGDLWDSGKVTSRQSVQVVYAGSELTQVREAWWKVRVWNNCGEVSAWSQPGYWGTGVRVWKAKWIGDEPDEALRDYHAYVKNHSADADYDLEYWKNPPYAPSPLLRKTFEVNGKVKRATLYASALGYYEIWLNGQRIGDQLQAPEWTNYADYVQYQTYDVTEQIREGSQVLAATLADGWALGRLAGIKWMRHFPHRGFYSLDRRLIAQLELELDDGSVQIIPTDGTWRICSDGFIRRADNYSGQTIDATKIPLGWNNLPFDDGLWKPVYVDESEQRHLMAQVNEPIRVHHVLKPVRIWQRKGNWMVDFGQNISGHCALKVKGKRGQVVTIKHGEWLNQDGSLYRQSLGYAQAIDTLILSGEWDEFDPTFTYHGFQFVEVEGLSHPLTEDQIVAKAVSSDPKIAGTFACSNADLNQLYRNIVWTQRNNMLSVLHDCPSRDERTGATGDIQIFAQSAIFNMNMAAFFSKFIQDEKDVAFNGQFYSMIPSLSQEELWNGWVGAPGWCEAGFIVPWRMYENYADIRALENLYAEMKQHVEATKKENPELIWKVRHNHNGDWLNANTIAFSPDTTYSTTNGATPDDLFSTAFFAYATRLLSNIATVLHQSHDARRYAELAEAIKQKFIEAYVDEDGHVEGNSQGAYSLALCYDLIPEQLRAQAFAHLVDCIKAYDYRLSTGFITTPMMMQLLADFNRTDIAYRLLESTRFPSWLYLVKQGATTVWERWDTWTKERGFQSNAMNSLDHVAFGSVSEWLFRHILGINPDSSNPGYEHFRIAPRPGGSLTWAKGSYYSIRGEISSSWRIEGDLLTLEVSIPINTTATVILPISNLTDLKVADGQNFHLTEDGKLSAEVGSGNYTFKGIYITKPISSQNSM